MKYTGKIKIGSIIIEGTLCDFYAKKELEKTFKNNKKYSFNDIKTIYSYSISDYQLKRIPSDLEVEIINCEYDSSDAVNVIFDKTLCQKRALVVIDNIVSSIGQYCHEEEGMMIVSSEKTKGDTEAFLMIHDSECVIDERAFSEMIDEHLEEISEEEFSKMIALIENEKTSMVTEILKAYAISKNIGKIMCLYHAASKIKNQTQHFNNILAEIIFLYFGEESNHGTYAYIKNALKCNLVELDREITENYMREEIEM